MMDFTTKYMGLELWNPIIVSSSELTGSVIRIKRLAESGAGAVVLKSIILSSPQEITESLRWIRILSAELKCSLAG